MRSMVRNAVVSMVRSMAKNIGAPQTVSQLAIQFNGGISGSLASFFSFSRNAATLDGLGQPVAIDAPRYDRERAVIAHVTEDAELAYASTSSNLYAGSGVDADGVTPLLFMIESSSNTIKVFKDSLSSVYLTNAGRNGGNWDLNNGADPLVRYTPVTGTICHGLIVVECQRVLVSSGDQEGVGILYSQDYGATFTVLEDTLGNKTLPNFDPGHTRVTRFCLQNWFPEVDGQDPPLAAWFAFTDYQYQTATGGQAALFRATRADIDSPWVVDNARLMHEVTGGSAVHMHSAFPIITDTKIGIVVSEGDTGNRNRMVLAWMNVTAPEDYTTAVISVNESYQGTVGTGAGVLYGQYGLQYTSAAPGPVFNSALVGADFNPEVISLVLPPDESDDWDTIKAKVEHIYGYNTQSENFAVICRNPITRRGYVSGHAANITGGNVNELFYSEDGYNWAELKYRGTSATSPDPTFFGNYLVDVVAAQGLYAIPIPRFSAVRPLLVGPGVKNRVGAHSQWTAPGAGCTYTKLTPNVSGLYEFPAGHPREGEVLPDQPQSMTEVWRVQATGESNTCGLRYISAVTDAITPTDVGSVVYGMLPLTDAGEHYVSRASSDTVQQIHTATETWAYQGYKGMIPYGTGSPRRAAMSLLNRSGVNAKPSDILITVVAHTPNGGNFTVGYPVAPDTDKSSVHEVAKLSAVPVEENWSVKASLGFPLLGIAGPSASSTPFLTIKSDADNYATVLWTAIDELTLSVVVGGGAAVTQTMAISTLREQKDRSFRLLVSRLADGNTELKATSAGSTIATAVVATSFTASELDILFGASADESLVIPLRVFSATVYGGLSDSGRDDALSSVDIVAPSPTTLTLTEAEYEALTEYDASTTYNVLGVGTYLGASLQSIEPWSYQDADIHVTKTGDDTTGDGSIGNPYLTISKAFSVVSAAGGKTIWVHEGTYAENNGSGYFLQSSKTFTDRLFIKAVPGHSVIWTHVSSTSLVRFNGTNSNVTIKGFEFVPISSSVICFTNPGAASVSGFELIECTFTLTTNATAVNIVGTNISANPAVKRCTFNGTGVNQVLFQNCNGLRCIGNTHNTTSAGAVNAYRIGSGCYGIIDVNSNSASALNAGATAYSIFQDTAITSPSVLSVCGNVVNTNKQGIYLVGGTEGNRIEIHCDRNSVTSTSSGITLIGGASSLSTCSGNSVISSSGTVGIGFPTDGSGPTVDGATISDNSVLCTGSVGHGLLIGINAYNCRLSGNTTDVRGGGWYGLVLKGDNHSVVDNIIWGGTNNALYLKGATGCTVTDNAINQSIADGIAIDFAADDVIDAQDNIVTENTVTITDGKLYGFAGLSIGSGNVINYNAYLISGSGSWGSMFGSAVTSLASVQASWMANYDQTTNDSGSS